MSATGLDVFDKTVQTTNIWLDEMMADIGPDRRVAWHVMGAVLRCLRDRLPAPLAAHLSAQLPLLVRGAFYDQYRPDDGPLKIRDMDAFLQHVAQGLADTRPVNARDATVAVFDVLSRHIPRGQCVKVRDALPDELKTLWQIDKGDGTPDKAAAGRAAQHAQEARTYQSRPDGQRRA